MFEFIKFIFTEPQRRALLAEISVLNVYSISIVANPFTAQKSKACDAATAFEILSKRYFGFGFFTSFISGTQGYRARQDYIKNCTGLSAMINNSKAVYGLPLAIQVSQTHFSFLLPFINNFPSLWHLLTTDIQMAHPKTWDFFLEFRLICTLDSPDSHNRKAYLYRQWMAS